MIQYKTNILLDSTYWNTCNVKHYISEHPNTVPTDRWAFLMAVFPETHRNCFLLPVITTNTFSAEESLLKQVAKAKTEHGKPNREAENQKNGRNPQLHHERWMPQAPLASGGPCKPRSHHTPKYRYRPGQTPKVLGWQMSHRRGGLQPARDTLAAPSARVRYGARGASRSWAIGWAQTQGEYGFA